jgi:hypothetical protein
LVAERFFGGVGILPWPTVGHGRNVVAAVPKAFSYLFEPQRCSKDCDSVLKSELAEGASTITALVERALNRISGSQAGGGIYNHHGYITEKCQALEVWAQHLDHVVRLGPQQIKPDN